MQNNQQTIKATHPGFIMDCSTFNKLLEHNNIRWFDIVLYNYIKDKAETYGVYDEQHQEYDRETKTTSRFKDKYGLITTDLQLSKVLQVKGNDDTAKKEISRSLKRLEIAEAIKREYIKMESKTIKETRIIIPLI
jgi:hypothetical protein